MLYLSKRTNVHPQSSNVEPCVSILGLFLAVGILGGLAVLIYGLVTGNSTATFAGGITLGASAFFSVILALTFIFCLKNNDVSSNTTDQRLPINQNQYKQHHRQKQHRRFKPEKTSTHELSIVSGIHQQNHLNEYQTQIFSPSVHNSLADSTHFGFGQQIPQSPLKPSGFISLNQSNNSVNSNNYNSPIKRTDYNRH